MESESVLNHKKTMGLIGFNNYFLCNYIVELFFFVTYAVMLKLNLCAFNIDTDNREGSKKNHIQRFSHRFADSDVS